MSTFRRMGLLACGLALAGCGALRTPSLLKKLNTTNPPDPGARPVSLAARVARLTRDHFADAYFDMAAVARWLEAVEREPRPLLDLLSCLTASLDAGDPDTCYEEFSQGVIPRRAPAGAARESAWGLPAGPLPEDVATGRLADLASAEAGAEMDAQRFAANARSLGASLSALQAVIGGGPLPEADLRQGMAAGAREARAYLLARKWHRDAARPTTALVMSGGAANGAFSAGAVYRLFDILMKCRPVPAAQGGCPDAHIDLAVGVSTGSLIGVTVDLFFTPGQEETAKALLFGKYTCSTEADLYCARDEWIWKLGSDVKGLVRFDGIERLLKDAIQPGMASNRVELVTVSVDYDSGDVHGLSDQDPLDAAGPDGRVQGILASIVEPVMAEPVDGLPLSGRPLPGTFVDGGVRSGLPLLEAVRRGAERVLVLSNSGIEPERMAPPRHALGILFRTISLFVHQPRVGEVQQGEMAAVVRRMAEYKVCTQRLDLAEARARRVFCERQGLFPATAAHPQGFAASFMGPQLFQEVATSWRTAWMFQPEGGEAAAGGYSFRPEVMQPLFLKGVRAFQGRCQELLRLLDVGGSIAQRECADSPQAVAQRIQLPDVAGCTRGKEELRKCRD